MINNSLILFILILTTYILCDPIELSDIIIREHTPIGHLLVTLNTTTTKLRNSYRFVSNNHREIQRYFSLNSSTGELRIAIDIDREIICTHRRIQCKFLLKIFELFNEKLYHIPILIEDINDHRPIFPYKTSPIELHISENSPPYQSKLFIQQAYDQDQLDNQKQLKYQLKNFEKNFPFILEINDDLSNRLALVLIQLLDRETIDSYNCTLYVTDTGGHEEKLHMKIIIDDVNDQSPIFDSETYSIELSENTSINTTILRVHAYDADIGLNGQITYDFTDASKQFNNIFSINNETGLIRLRSSLDYEQRSSYIFYIEARDSGKEIRSSQTLINITILDENDCYPIITFRFLSELNYNSTNDIIEISETYPIDKFFIQILVTDQDSLLNGQVNLWYEILDEYNPTKNHSFNLYQIDNSTYFLNRTKSFDYEYQQKYYLKFFAQDLNPKKPLQTIKYLTINILDENDNIPQFLHSFYHLSVYENNQINTILTKIEAYDSDNGNNGRLKYEILTNETLLPFDIDSDTGFLRCLEIFDREKRSYYHFEIIVRDYGYPISLSNKIPIEIDIKDINDNKPIFEHEKYNFSIEENFPKLKSFGIIRATDQDLNTNLIYQIEKETKFGIKENGEIYLRDSIDREIQDQYNFIVTVGDKLFQTSVSVHIDILDINDCQPRWINPSENRTVYVLNKDVISIGTNILKFDAIDYDDIANGNGLISYFIENKYEYFDIWNNNELILNSTPNIGEYRLKIYAQDHGKTIQYATLIEIYIFIGDNHTNGSLFYESFSKINSLSSIKRIILFSTFFLSIIFILIFIICIVIIMICRYKKQKYLYYIKCNHQQKMTMIESRLTRSSSNSSKLSLEDLHQKHFIDHSSSPSYTGANIYSQHHQISSIIQPTQTTSDYYSNSSKHEEDVDEWTDEQQRLNINNNDTEWSIEKILYPDWLYKDITTTTATSSTARFPKKHLNTSTFTDFNSCQTFATNESALSSSRSGRRTISSNSQPSPKQVRFGCQDQIRSYPHLNTTIRQLKTGTTTTISNNEAHHTFI
ncbi:unnamed protein product [Adineta steineri]|uniref:Cadherin domain-containing protein n=1 Tax=Adineta steineri TaxID=433720 RepID=A0A814W3J8_9BILA|nr:unnamed protein product [Adineta steineri]